MPILRMQEIREMSPDERDRRLDELRTELSKLRTMINAGGSVENPGRVKAIRKAIAKILTVMKEEELKA
ncbi:MAG: 50S ribosomal protein L29 [Candidatus Bathyarchaeia archaeon]